ncbi:MAG: tetratricopeptide repeat protein [Syntrophales bacterium]
MLGIATVLISATLIYYLIPDTKKSPKIRNVFITGIILLLIYAGSQIRNCSLQQARTNELTPKLKISIFPFDNTLTQYKYPLQDYNIHIANENMKSVDIRDLTIEFLFPNIVSQANGHISLYSGGPVWVTGMRSVVTNEKGRIFTEEKPAESQISKTCNLSIQKWEKNKVSQNSNSVIFSCERFPPNSAYIGTIVIDLTKSPTGIVKTPDEIGKYVGRYYYEIDGKKFPSVTISDKIPSPNHEIKLSEHYYDQGISFMKGSKYQKAILRFSEAIKLNPKHHLAYFRRAYSYGILGKLDDALTDFNKVIEISPNFAEAYFNRAITLAKKGNQTQELRKKDFCTAWNLGFEAALKPCLLESLSEINPNDGVFVIATHNKNYFEKNGKYYTVIPHISKTNFEMHGYKDKNDVLNILISNAFCNKAILQFAALDKLRTPLDNQNHEIKVTWYNGENKLYLDGALVDIYPKSLGQSKSHAKDDGYLFRTLSSVNTEQGTIEIDLSNKDWLESNSQFITVIPHIITKNFEIHGYRDKDNIFKILISNAHFHRALLQFKDISKLIKSPNHPKHTIEIRWNSTKAQLVIDKEVADTLIVPDKAS